MSPKYLIASFVTMAVFVAFPPIARSSLGVEYAMVGCIKGDKFYMHGPGLPV